MQLFPTRAAVQVALAGVAVVGAGIVLREPAVLGWGGAMLLGVAIARAATTISVARIRAAGFEMLWSGQRRVERTVRGGEVTLDAEVRTRDSRAARFVSLRVVASGLLDVALEPSSGEVPAGGRLLVKIRVSTPRVGRHGLHGLALEVLGQPGLFEVPLTFANPFGIEVLPRAFAASVSTARGGRGRVGALEGRPGRLPGEGSELRELRDHAAGDPFKRIAWKASAKRGKLLVREMEREERDVVWLVLDASVELWAGRPGHAPLDTAIDELATRAVRHLGRGDRVGLAVVAARQRVWLTPDRGASHSAKIAMALAVGADTLDSDRSDWDEGDVAMRVHEHLAAIEPRVAAKVSRRDLDALATRADRVREKAPFACPPPAAPSSRERSLRQYLACFGVEAPPRIEPDRPRTDEQLCAVLTRMGREKKLRPSVVYVASPAPETATDALSTAVRKLARGGVRVEWIAPRHEAALDIGDGPSAQVVADAVAVRARVARERGERILRGMGVRIARPRASTARADGRTSLPPPPPAPALP